MTASKSYPITTRHGDRVFSASYELADGVVRVFSAYGSKAGLVSVNTRVTAVKLLDEIINAHDGRGRGAGLQSGRR